VYYLMMPFYMAFLFMTTLTFYAVYQSIVYNRQEISLLGLVGAYAIPFLISRNAERADLFFLYISLINIGVVFISIKKNWTLVGRLAQSITWLLFLGWAASRYEISMKWTGFLFMIFFFLIFALNALSKRIFQGKELSVADGYSLVTNNLAFYLASLFLFGSSFEETDVAMVTFWVSAFVGVQAFASYILWKERSASRMLASLSFVLFIVFIAFNWSGLTVTLLWLLTAIILFTWGVMKHSPSARMGAIILMGLTLLKLVVLDSMTFTTVQKVISYIILGILLLVVSFSYQKFKTRIFGKE
jgi:uncharacterized membrane protein